MELTKNELNATMTNVSLILEVIEEINKNVKLPDGHTSYSYFMTGHCNVFAIILTMIFDGYATPYSSDDHVITKIGNYYYDTLGVITDLSVLSKYKKDNIEWLRDMCDITGLGSFEIGVDDVIVKEGVNLGKTIIQDAIEKEQKIRYGESL